MTIEQAETPADILGAAAREIARVNLEIAELTEYKQTLLGALKDENNGLLPRKEAYDFGDVEVKVSEAGRIDDSLARKHLSPSRYKQVAKQTIDTTLARKVLDDTELFRVTKKYENKIEVKLK